jgi:chemotaxis protein methyltransferase CheR
MAEPRKLSEVLQFLLESPVDCRSIFNTIMGRTDLQLAGYREEYLLRRIAYHFVKTNTLSIKEYIYRLAHEPVFLDELLDYLMINVSSFFRDPKSFTYLETEILPSVLEKLIRPRIWSAGCSIGTEIYSIALILNKLDLLEKTELVASDNDPQALSKGKSAIYTENEMKSLPQEYLQYFHKNSSGAWEIQDNLRKAVNFLQHDLFSEQKLPGRFGIKSFDLLVCRNVTIYFSQDLKEKIYKLFTQCINPGGILFVGANEALCGPAEEAFKAIHKQFYQKI